MKSGTVLKLVEQAFPEHVVDADTLTATQLRKKYHGEYSSWRNMKYRAKIKNKPIGAELVDFYSFLKVMGLRPNTEYTLDEIEHGKGYIVGNVRWADKLQQAQNQQHSITLTYNGVTKPLSQWAAEVGMPYQTLYKRYQQNWSDEEILHGKKCGDLKKTNIWDQTPWPEGYEPQWEQAYQEKRGNGESRFEFYYRHSKTLCEMIKIKGQEYFEEVMPQQIIERTSRYRDWVRDALLKLEEWRRREKFINRQAGNLGKATEAKLYDILHGKPKPYIENPLAPDKVP
ncbi:hypothetical protein NH8B_1050 [Pseudogulbenkiania sp. NH8B]|uniref:hypothetical protein n=1 Tax=Pseudogulbenkiania sp. (strain NH8B) TaxID=748280 RepID=UPI0002279B8D|nr:hypothetical protein [Pseudogulbenkiania sp. NH8B]BAK75882.1 hypothetical protein NH8B_1050 [Pseudogulbenkiania sp. NH8B]